MEGGAICYLYLHSKSRCFFTDSIFNNNTAFSGSSSSKGGAILMNIIEEIFKNCTFNNNIARTFLSGYLTSGTEPRSM